MIHLGFCEILAAIHLPRYLLTRQPLPNAFLGHHKRKYTLESNEGTHEQNRFFFSFFFFFTLKNNNSAHMKQNLRPPKTQTQKSDHGKKKKQVIPQSATPKTMDGEARKNTPPEQNKTKQKNPNSEIPNPGRYLAFSRTLPNFIANG
jgi:hypothetical protein